MILVASVSLEFVYEYKAAKTAEALHSSIHHTCVTWREGHPHTVDVTELVPDDVVDLQLGQVPAERMVTSTEAPASRGAALESASVSDLDAGLPS